MTVEPRHFRRGALALAAVAAAVLFVAVPLQAANDPGNAFTVTRLVSNQPGVAQHTTRSS